MQNELHRYWHGDPKELLKPLEDVVKDHRRNELHQVRFPAKQKIVKRWSSPLNDHGWRVQFDYEITQHGTRELPYEVSILTACLRAGGKEIDLPLSFFPADALVEYRQCIEVDLNER